jgi:hypothetical protein
MKQVISLIFALLLASNTQGIARDKYITKDGKLGESLTLKDGQGGFTGVTGSIWAVQPDGSWEHKRFLNKKVDKADRKGKLTGRQLQSLASVLAHAHVDKLPDKLGNFRGANPHVVTLSWGKVQCVWTLPAGSPVPEYLDFPFGKLTPKDGFAEIYQVMGKLLKSNKDK